MNNKKIFLAILLFTAFPFIIKAQSGAIDHTFNPTDVGFGLGDGANGDIYTTVIQSDGKIIIGGYFTSYNETGRRRIARLNADGTIDSTFNPGTGVNNSVKTIVVQSDGKIIVGGAFTSNNGTARSRVTRLNADGTLDTTFNPGTGTNGDVYAIAIQSDGKILISGRFTLFNGCARNRIARLTANGIIDSTFNPGTGADGDVYTSAIQSDGKILIGGDFSSYNGAARSRVARLNTDGTLDALFNPGTGVNNSVKTIAVQSDGKILIGGNFTSYNETARNRLIRLNADGTLDATFNLGAGVDNFVETIAIQIDGKIMIGGYFLSYNGTQRRRIARLNADGTLDVTFNPGSGADNYVESTTIQSDGKIIIGGLFNSYNLKGENYIARLNADGTLDATFNPGTGANGYVRTTAIQSDGKIIIGGQFSSYNENGRNYIARLNTDGSLDSTFNSGTGTDLWVTTTAIQSDGKIIIGGWFNSYNGTAINSIARLKVDGTLDTTFNSGMGADNYVSNITIQPDGKILIGGWFTSYNGTARKHIARLNANGTLDVTFNPGIGANNYINTTAVQSDGKIIIGGVFTSYNGTERNRIARLNANGTLDVTFNPGTGASNYVETTAVQSDGKILIGGQFTSYNGTGRYYIARLNSDGTLDGTFNLGTGANDPIFTIVVQSDGNIIIGGQFTSYNGTGRNYIARLNADGSLDATFDQGTGANSYVLTTSIQNDGKIIIGGNLTSYNGIGRNHIARIHVNCVNSFSSISKTVCDSYTAPNGLVYTTSGVKTVFIHNAAGCDSMITINLTVNQSTASSITETACDSYTAPDGQVYTTSGIKTAVIPNAAGCDSTITINLTINTFDVSVTVNSLTITSNVSGATYQWVDCDNGYLPIPGAINQSFTATANGSYAVIVTQELCSDTSVCTEINSVGMSSEHAKAAISIYLNPISNELNIELEGNNGQVNFEILNSIGQIVFKGIFVDKTTVQASNFAPGVYLIKLENGKTTGIKKIIKE